MLCRDRLSFIRQKRDGGVYTVTFGELHPAVRRSPELKAEEFLNEIPLSVGANDNIPATSTGLFLVGFYVFQVSDLQRGYGSGWAVATFGL